MNTDQFWQLIDATRGQPERGDMLTAALATLPPDEIIRFQLLYDDVLLSANTVDLRGAAHQLMSGCSDGAFSDFREGLVERGRGVFDAAVRDPDSLAGVFADGDPIGPTEDLHGAAGAAWMGVTGKSENDFFDAVDAADDRTD